MTEEMPAPLACPKDGAEMSPTGRRPGVWRCPACRSVFVDVAAARAGRGRAALIPVVASVLLSVGLSLLVTVVVRRLRAQQAAD